MYSSRDRFSSARSTLTLCLAVASLSAKPPAPPGRARTTWWCRRWPFPRRDVGVVLEQDDVRGLVGLEGGVEGDVGGDARRAVGASEQLDQGDALAVALAALVRRRLERHRPLLERLVQRLVDLPDSA